MPLVDGSAPHRPGKEGGEGGRLWVPGTRIPDDVGAGGGAAMVCSPYTKYIFVKPQGGYTTSEFINWRDDNAFVGSATLNAVGAFVFDLGDSSSCGGTVIQHDPTNPAQAFLRDDATKDAFTIAGLATGGFFLIGDQQGVGAAAGEIKKIIIDCNLEFIVLALHRGTPGTQPDITVAAFTHLVASIRWDIGPLKPIILMVGDENENVHLMPESTRGQLFVGDISDQDTESKQTALLDRAGYIDLNWWPMMAFVPNADNGISVFNSMVGMQNRLFHPLLIPAADNVCPFFTTRALTNNELGEARALFVTPVFPGPLAEPKVRTTSMWFWDWAKVRNNTRVKTWSVLRNNLDGSFANIDYMSDMQAAFTSKPAWVGHPIYDMPWAMEFRMDARSVNTIVTWDRDTHGPGNVPALHGMKDNEEGWLTIVTPFELSPTANRFYLRDVYQDDPRGVPVIPPWVEFRWIREIEEEEIANAEGSGWLGIPGFPSPGDVISGLIDLAGDALVWLPNQIYDLSTNQEGFTKWSAGLNQPHVILSGTPGGGAPVGVDEGGIGVTVVNSVNPLSLRNAPFAVEIRTVNFKVGPVIDPDTGEQRGFVWPSKVFNIIPIAISSQILESFDPVSTPAGLTLWNDLDFDLGGHGSTPMTFEADEQITEGFANLHIPRFDILFPLLDHKADFPPMMDSTDATLNRDFSNHLARIDITHPRVLRSREPNFGGGGGPGSGGGVATRGVLTSWPLRDDREIRITQDFFGRATEYECGDHRALDLVYTDGSANTGTPILAAGPGIVNYSHCSRCGPFIEITHQLPPLPSTNSFKTWYLHLDTRLAADGAFVDAGDIIGLMGDRGSPGALHLHFSIYMDGTCWTARNPCDELPIPANGTSPAGCGVPGGFGGTPIAELICTLFGAAIANAGASPLFTDLFDNTWKKTDLALAIARAESGLVPTAGYPPNGGLNRNSAGLITSIDRGLFQVNSGWVEGFPGGSAPALLAAGIISPESIETFSGPDFARPIQQSTDLYIPSINIEAAIFISGVGSSWTNWSTYNGGQYRDSQGQGCP